jgi:hypothetical protein
MALTATVGLAPTGAKPSVFETCCVIQTGPVTLGNRCSNENATTGRITARP